MKKRALTLIVLTLALVSFAADALVCGVCKKAISGHYLKSVDGKIYCGRACATRVRPRCSVCAKPIKGEYFDHKGKLYCGQKCLKTVMPKCLGCNVAMKSWKVIVGEKFCDRCAKLDRCTDCMLPCREGMTYKDDRIVCKSCLKTVFASKKDVLRLFAAARGELKKLTGLQTDALPELILTSRAEIIRLAEKQMGFKPAGIIRGFYQRTEHFARRNDKKPRRVVKKVNMLYGMRKETYAITSVHELTHDLIAEKFPRLKAAPIWVEEGICQYNAYTVSLKYKLKDHATVIFQHPDKAYGDGFRYFLAKFGPNNWKKLQQWMETVDVASIPKQAPKLKKK